MGVPKDEVIKELRKVIDPETGIDVVSMGLIRGVEVNGGNVKVKFRPTSPFCPLAWYLVAMIEEACKRVKGVEKVEVVYD